MKKYYIKPLLEEKLGVGTGIIRKITGGMMNRAYLCQDKKGDQYIIYIPFKRSNALVNRKEEKHHYDILKKFEIYQENVYFDVKRGIKINKCIPGLSLNLYKGELDYEAIANLLHRLHSCTTLSNLDYMPFAQLARFEHALLKYHPESNKYRELRDFLSCHEDDFYGNEKCLCHNDAQKSNIIIDKNGEYHLIDFEFMANNDPLYDVATFGNNSLEDMDKLFEAYTINPTIEQWKRLYLYRIFISLQWHALALIKHHQKEGALAKYNYLNVAKHFLENASLAKEKYDSLK